MLSDINRAIEREIKIGIQSYRAELIALRAEFDKMKRQERIHDHEISALKRELAELSANDTHPTQTNPVRRFRPGNIPRLRKELGLTEIELATLLNVSNVTVSRWEKGKRRPRLKTQMRLAELRSLGKRKVKKLLMEKKSI